MSTSHNQPRRRPATGVAPPSMDSISDSMNALALHKALTFHVESEQNLDLLLQLLEGPSVPPRSLTCPKALEDLLLGAGQRRAEDLLQKVDDAIASGAELRSILSEPEVLPVPKYSVENADAPCISSTRRSSLHSINDDSGIGSSISSPTTEKLECTDLVDHDNTKAPMPTVTPSISGSSTTIKAHRSLSEFAQKQVDRLVIQPILAQESLKHFHSLIRKVTRKIDSKEIRTLRDLERTLIRFAPEYSLTPDAYRSFCGTSIQHLYLAVRSVHESDRCLPTDRPYTTGYFVDLVQQIARYASILAATREKQARGETLDKMDFTPTDRIELQGGLTENGKPAVLARVKNSEHISLADNKPLPAEDVSAKSNKRPATDTIDQDSARRSMARPKKGALPKSLCCSWPGCTVAPYKRDCDLKKHMKTHMREWKCPVPGCTMTRGFPTEVELDRHRREQHDSNPTMFPCDWPGCTHSSKRFTNLQQHRSTRHNIPYIKTRKGGKRKTPKGQSAAAGVPEMLVSPPDQPSLDFGAPFSPDAPSSSASSAPAFSPSTNSIAHTETVVAGPSTTAPMLSDQAFFSADLFAHFPINNTNLSPSNFTISSWNEGRRGSLETALTNYSPFEGPLAGYDNVTMIPRNQDFSNLGAPNQWMADEMYNDENIAGHEQTIGFQQQFVDSADLSHFSPRGQDLPIAGVADEFSSMNGMYPEMEHILASGPSSSLQTMVPQFFSDVGALDSMGSQFQAGDQSQSLDDMTVLFGRQ